ESLLLGCAGGALGLLLAHAGVTALRAAAPPGLPRLEEIGLDARALWQTLAISVLSGALFGLAPALGFTGVSLGEALQEGGRTGGDSRRKQRVRALLVTVEVAM